MSQTASSTGSRSGSGDVPASLTPIERGLVLDALLVAHLELSDEAEAILASALLSSPSAGQSPSGVCDYAREDGPSVLAADLLDSTEVPGLAIPDEVAAMLWPEWDDLL
jgi:hypothetical protein